MDAIASTAQPLPAIAAINGFRHLSHFSAAFKKHFDITPREAVRRYRRPDNG